MCNLLVVKSILVYIRFSRAKKLLFWKIFSLGNGVFCNIKVDYTAHVFAFFEKLGSVSET